MTVVDGGAHVGYYSVLAAQLVGTSGSVYAFEPIASNYQFLINNIRLNRVASIVKPELLALTSTGGRLSMNWSPWTPFAASVLGPAPEAPDSKSVADHNVGRVTVAATSLDLYFESMGWPRCDFIKLDIEGHEGAALLGMPELIKRNPQVKLVAELAPWSISHNEADELWSLVSGLGLSACSALDAGALRRVRTRLEFSALYDEVKARPRHGSNVNVLYSAGDL